MFSVRVLLEAKTDYKKAYAWYFKESPKAAARFTVEFATALDKVLGAPKRWPFRDRRHRYYLLDRYPYQLIYRIERDEIVIVAVAHAKRSQRYWRGRNGRS